MSIQLFKFKVKINITNIYTVQSVIKCKIIEIYFFYDNLKYYI